MANIDCGLNIIIIIIIIGCMQLSGAVLTNVDEQERMAHIFRHQLRINKRMNGQSSTDQEIHFGF